MKKIAALVFFMSLSVAAAAPPALAETPDEMFRTAVQLFDNADYDLSAEQFQKFITMFPKDAMVPDAVFGLAESNFSRGSVKDALAAFERIIAEYPSSEKLPDAKLRKGYCYYMLLDYTKAVESFKAFIGEYPDRETRAEAFFMLGNSYMKMGSYDKAADAFSELAKKYPNSPRAAEGSFLAGESYTQQGDYQKARLMYQSVLADPKLGRKAAFKTAVAAFLGRQYDEARKGFEEFLQKYPDSEDAPLARWKLGESFFNTGGYENALINYETFLAAYPASEYAPEVEYSVAEAYYQMKDYQKARDKYTALLTKFPDGAGRDRYLYGLGWSCFKLGDTDASADAFSRLADTYPDSEFFVGAMLKQGEIFMRGKKYLDAAGAFGKALAKARDPQDKKTAKYDLAWAYYQARLYKEAAPLYEELAASAEGKDAAEPKYLLARCRLYVGDFPPAIAGFTEVADNYKDSPLVEDALTGLAEAYERHEELYKAINAYRRLLKDYPETKKKPEVLFSIGRNYLDHGNCQQAQEAFGDYFAQVPDSEFHERAYYGLAEAYYGTKDYQKAKEQYEAYLKRYPQGGLRDQVLYGLAWALKGVKDYRGSYDSFSLFVSDFKDSPLVPEATLEMGEAMYAQEKYADAARIYSGLIKGRPGSDAARKAVYVLAWAELKQGMNKEAADGFKAYSEANPKDPLSAEADFQRALIHIQLNELDRASEVLRAIIEKHGGEEVGTQAKLQLAKVLNAKGSAAEAQALLDDLKKGQASTVAEEAAFQTGLVKFNEGKYPEAEKAFQEFIAAYPSGEYAMKAAYFLGISRYNQKDYARCAEDLKKVADGPDQELKADAVYWLADTLYNLGRYEESLKMYDRFITSYPAGKLAPEAEYGRAWAYDKLGRAAEAKAAFKSMTVKYPGGAHISDCWYKFGEYAFKEKSYEEVAAAFSNYLSDKSVTALRADANYMVGVAQEELGKGDAAVLAYAAVEAAGGPLRPAAALRAGKLLLKAGKGQESLAHFDLALSDKDFSSEALVGKGKAFMEQKRYDDALASLRRAADFPADTPVRAEGYFLAGEACRQGGRFKDAVVEYTKATVLGESPSRGVSMLGMASSYASLGEKEKALNAYRKFLESYPGHERAAEARDAVKKLGGQP